MSVYAVFLNQKDESAWQTVKEKWPTGRHFILDGRLAFVAPEGITTTSEVGETVGIVEERLPGIVLEIKYHSGFNRRELWEWLDEVRV